MPIWKTAKTIDELNRMSENTLHEHLCIEFIEIGNNFLKSRMPVDEKVFQPHGILHGGASVVLAETTGSMAAEMCIDSHMRCMGLSIEAKHLRPVTKGYICCIARPMHLGKRTQLWDIDISNEEGRMVCVSRLTMAVLEQGHQKRRSFIPIQTRSRTEREKGSHENAI